MVISKGLLNNISSAFKPNKCTQSIPNRVNINPYTQSQPDGHDRRRSKLVMTGKVVMVKPHPNKGYNILPL